MSKGTVEPIRRVIEITEIERAVLLGLLYNQKEIHDEMIESGKGEKVLFQREILNLLEQLEGSSCDLSPTPQK